MTDPLRGLRFDIYERVHLPDDVASIKELEEIELVPHMKALPQDDQVLLKGHLLLSGVYRAQDSAESVSQLEHWIPVEITLPINRVEKVEELAVEIDNFDVDLLSARSLNVTGVLALRGIQVAAPQLPVWRDDSFTVVHQAPVVSETEEADGELEAERFEQQAVWEQVPEPEPLTASEMPGIAHPEEDRFSEPPPVSEYSAPYYPSTLPKETGVWPTAMQEPEIRTEAETDQQPAYDLEQWIRAQEARAQSRETENTQSPQTYNDVPEHTGWGDLSASRPSESEISIPEYYTPVPEEKPEMKVAVGVKPVESAARTFSGVGFLSQLGEKGAAREAELQAMRLAQAETEESDPADSKSRTSTGDELEWTRLFLSKGADAEPFRKVKLCIVQREDTLEAIAARYNVQTRELQLHNRLSDPYLSAGQVLYIP